MSKFNKNLLLDAVQQVNVKLSNGTTIRVRSFLVREFKLLMMANESNTSINDTIIQVLEGCIVKGNVDIATLPMFDIEKIYIAIWRISKGTSILPIKFACSNLVKDEDGNSVTCNNEIKVNVNIAKATLSKVPNTDIVLSPMLSVKMKFPNILESEYFVLSNPSDSFDLVLRCIESVTLNNVNMVVGKDIDPKELDEIIDYIDEDGYKKLTDFISDIPVTSLTIPVVCDKCGHSEPVTLRGLSDFFD